jgi:hypothetical protein
MHPRHPRAEARNVGAPAGVEHVPLPVRGIPNFGGKRLVAFSPGTHFKVFFGRTWSDLPGPISACRAEV